ncbi:MAG: ribosome assembly RNA-binding protein YhbY [Firmicutes bacterium]|nr:ribosome assembly RNA-binding protein YhbY [Bacillota bacterium]
MNSKQRAYLRSLGNELEPIFQIGKGGLSDELLDQLDAALEARELIKVRVLKNCLDDEGDIADEISEALDCDVVQRIGRVILLYRPSIEDPRIVLP